MTNAKGSPAAKSYHAETFSLVIREEALQENKSAVGVKVDSTVNGDSETELLKTQMSQLREMMTGSSSQVAKVDTAATSKLYKEAVQLD